MKKTSIELQKLEKALQNEEIDPRLLEEYRDAVDYIRTAAGVVQQLRECQLRGSDDSELFSVLAAERIRRATKLCLEVIADVEAGRVKHETKGVDEMNRAIKQLHDRMGRVVKVPPTSR